MKKIKRKYLYKILKYKNINHTKNILKLSSLKKAHIYCKINKLSGQISGPLIETYIIKKYNLIKNKSKECNGDCSMIYNNTIINFEIKASFGGIKHNKFNYVQLRLNHNIDYYIFTSYYLSNENVKKKGELFVFLINKTDIKNMVLKYGNYAHGTLNKNGKRTFETLNDDNKYEYALRPIYNDNCWNELLNYRVDKYNIFEKLNTYINCDSKNSDIIENNT